MTDKPALLTEDEVDALPAGTAVVVIWSGGNGPHTYYVHKNRYGQTLFGSHPPGTKAHDCLHTLPYIGEYPLTQVWLKESQP